MAKNSKADQITPWIKPVTTIAGIWAGWRFVVKPILEGLGLKDTDAELASKKLQDKVENYAADKNYWSPRFYQNPPSGYVSMILTYQVSNSLAQSLDDAAGIFNDDESQIYAVFRSLKYKTQVSYLAYWFNKLYNKDLYQWLKGDVLNNEELQVVLKITEQLPNGFKNRVTGTISGKTNNYQYFENIVDSISKDETKWAKSLYKSLSSSQRNAFWKWYETTYFYEAQSQENFALTIASFKANVEQLKNILDPGLI